MSNLIEGGRLIPLNQSINASSGDVAFNSRTVDLRRGTPRINAIVARGLSPGSFGLDYRVFYYGGITTSEIDGTPTGDIDRFEEPTVNAPIISTYPNDKLPDGTTDSEGYQAWIVAPVPAILTPYVRFHLLVKGGSAADAQFNLYAVFQRRFDI